MIRILAAFVLLASAAGAQTGIFDEHGDIGITPRQGSMEYDSANGEYRVTGGGANIWADQDAFQFVWKRLSGDAVISADVRFLGTGTVAHRKAVLMFRQDLTPGSAYADIALHGDGLTSLQYRPAAGAQTQEIRSTVTAPVRLRIERHGNQFTIAAGKPGEQLTSAGPATVVLKDPVYVGIGVCSHDANLVETAVFSNVRAGAPQPPPQRLRSKITIYDRTTKTTRVVYTADEVWEAPNWSRDGKFLLANSGGNLFRLPLDGSSPVTPQKLDLPAGFRCNNDHDLSPDGKMVAISCVARGARQSQVYLAAADGRDPRLMTPSPDASYFHGWSPDGRWLAFVGQRNGKFELYRVPEAGGGEQRLTSRGAYDDGPDYSPDGKWIYFNSDRSGGWDIWRIPAAGAGPDDKNAERVTSDDLEDWFPHVSPDGKWIVFLSFPKGTANHNGRMKGVELRMIAAPGKRVKPEPIRTLLTIFGGQGSINVNSWSPDSMKFAFVEYEPM